jgi:hypothetical protein
LVGLESTIFQKRLAFAAVYWVVGWKSFFIFVHKNKQPTKQEQEQEQEQDKSKQQAKKERRQT